MTREELDKAEKENTWLVWRGLPDKDFLVSGYAYNVGYFKPEDLRLATAKDLMELGDD